MKTTKSCLAYAINICKKWVDPVQHFGNSEWKKEMGILLLDDNLKPRKFKNFLTLLKNQQSKQNPVRTLIEKTVTCIRMMSFIYNWGHSWWPVGCCIPADVCGLEYRMPACTMSQRFLHQLPALKWEEISHTHTHTHTPADIFLLSFEKKKRFMNNETIFSPGHYLLVWSKSTYFSPAFHISLGQFFLVLSITYLSLPIVSVFWSVPDDIWCVPLSIWKKISPSL